jgi:circadian clock protein KaiB
MDKPPKQTLNEFSLAAQRRGKEHYELRLFIVGSSPHSLRAIENLRSICKQFLPKRFNLEIVDILRHPASARQADIVGAPTLIKQRPTPVRRLVGDLSNRRRVLGALGLSGGNFNITP